MDWAQILVIVLAVLFIVFLALAIALAVLLIAITRQIKLAAKSAERTISTLENSVSAFNKVALPLALTKGILNQFRKTTTKKAKKPKDGKE